MFRGEQRGGRIPKIALEIGTILFVTTISVGQVPAESLMTDTTLASCEQQKGQAVLRETLLGTHGQEPGEDYLVNEDLNIITGLYTREYALQGDGVVDYRTARQIVVSEYNEYWNSVAYTKEFPLFYWADADHDGQFDMWVDQKGEGFACDIVPYQVNAKTHEEPRGLF